MGRQRSESWAQLAVDALGPIVEPVLQIDDIQGNILEGFNKDYQALLGLRISDVRQAKAWIAGIAPHIASMAEVVPHNALFRAMRIRQGEEPVGIEATWINIAFSYPGLRLLIDHRANQLPDSSFRRGLYSVSRELSDPPGSIPQWKVGGSEASTPHVLVIVASDTESRRDARVDDVKRMAIASELSVIYEEKGATLANARGHEHFGFKDGISQPAIRGRLSDVPDDFYMPRLPSSDPNQPEFSRPGQPLVWPGQFVFGYPRQSGQFPRHRNPKPVAPTWADNGSYLVFRRLRQDVQLFWSTLEAKAKDLAAAHSAFRGMSATRLGAMLVGRWPSGAPMLRARHRDDPQLGGDPQRNNDFLFHAEDASGVICPLAAHIRKVNPRDDPLEDDPGATSLPRRILRRGIPYGPPYDESNADLDRGLLFLCYQTSIIEQFEFLIKNWTNGFNFPKSEGGHDIVIGQNAEGPLRTCNLRATPGDSYPVAMVDFVSPTGGGYFFAPSISALAETLAKP
jgi:Dyp-type peroxidase family